MAKVRLDKLRKVYPNGHVGVADASFEIADGELLVLVGPSGCGAGRWPGNGVGQHVRWQAFGAGL